MNSEKLVVDLAFMVGSTAIVRDTQAIYASTVTGVEVMKESGKVRATLANGMATEFSTIGDLGKDILLVMGKPGIPRTLAHILAERSGSGETKVDNRV